MRDELIELRQEVLGLANVCRRDERGAEGALWCVLAKVIEQVLEAGLC